MCETPRPAEPLPPPPNSAPVPVLSPGCDGTGYPQPKEASDEECETQQAKKAKPTPSLERANSSTSSSQPDAFSTLMSGARRAARVVPWTLCVEAGTGWRAVLGGGGSPDAAGPGWASEMELRGGGGGTAQKLRLLAPSPESAPPMPPARAPVRLASAAALKSLLSLLKSALQKNVRRCRVDEAVRRRAATAAAPPPCRHRRRGAAVAPPCHCATALPHSRAAVLPRCPLSPTNPLPSTTFLHSPPHAVALTRTRGWPAPAPEPTHCPNLRSHPYSALSRAL